MVTTQQTVGYSLSWALILLLSSSVYGFNARSSSCSSSGSINTNMSAPPSSTTNIVTLGGSTLQRLVLEAAEHDVQQTMDVSGILWTEHINLVVGSKELAQYFYMEFLGCTKDASKSFHVNLGQQQFHLAENGEPAQVIAGSIGLTVPSLVTIRERVKDAQIVLEDTLFAILSDTSSCITLRCPWGNVIHLYSVQDDKTIKPTLDTPRKMENMHALGGAYGTHRMAIRGNPGIRCIEIACPMNKSSLVAQFYREMLGCTVMETTVPINNNDNVNSQAASKAAVVCVGPGVHLAFIEHDNVSEHFEAMEGVHVCFYANDFKGLYNRLSKRGLIWTNPRFVHLDTCDTWEEAMASRTLRFKDVIDLSTGEKILELEHETRPLRHGQYLKVPLYEPR